MRAEETVVWRREFGVDALSADSSIVEEEARTGKEIVMGWDVNQRPCLYMFPYRQNVRVPSIPFAPSADSVLRTLIVYVAAIQTKVLAPHPHRLSVRH